MKFKEHPQALEVIKEKGDKIYSETAFFHAVKKMMNKNGYDLVKKDPQKDGHLTSAPYYLRDRKWKFCFHDTGYMVRDISRAFNKVDHVFLLKESLIEGE